MLSNLQEHNLEKKKFFGGKKMDSTTMYVSYAKDLFVAMYKEDSNPLGLMEQCISLIKKAKEQLQ